MRLAISLSLISIAGPMHAGPVVQAYGGLATVAQQAGITREALYRALSPSGNPTLKTLLAVLHAVGMMFGAIV